MCPWEIGLLPSLLADISKWFPEPLETAQEYTICEMMYITGLDLAGILYERGIIVLSVEPRVVPRHVAMSTMKHGIKYHNETRNVVGILWGTIICKS